MSMAHGLEVRSPFLDTELLAYTSRLHPRLKARGLSLKRVLKAAVADLVAPRDHAPRQARLRRSARPLVPRGPPPVSRLDARGARCARQAIPRAGSVGRVLAEHDAGVRSHGHALWTLLTLEVFLRANW